MSVKDFGKQYNFKNMTTGEIFCTIDDDDFSLYGDNNYIDNVSINVPIGDVRVLNAIHECFANNHGVLISIGYKP